MFTPFYFLLKERKVPVSISEWMILMEALSKRYIHSLEEFYYVARAILIKNEAYFDHYDLAFQEYFRGIEAPFEVTEELINWLLNPFDRPELSAEQLDLIKKMDLDELLKEFEKRLREQNERHDGGNHWIGTGGTSPFGHSGRNPQGIRVGGTGRGRSAIKIAEDREFRNYRNDIVLDTRQIKMALKQLRKLNRTGAEEDLDLEETINATCKNAGDLEFRWKRPRKNTVKLLLLMDAGGSMEPFADLCSQLFSAAHSLNHFKSFEYFYFHNCPYDFLYTDMRQRKGIPIERIFKLLEPDYKVVFVSDACMAPSELLDARGYIYYYGYQKCPGIERLQQFKRHFTHTAWLNPDPFASDSYATVEIIKKLFPMYELTLDGLQKAIKKLTTRI